MYENRSYQAKLIAEIELLLEKKGKAALCATCASGKTWMANKIIRNYLEKNPTERVLILAHGRTQLRDQFFTDLSEAIQDVSQWLNKECPPSKVVVALPYVRKKNIPKFGMIVFDEAHHYYTASMAQLILTKVQHDKLLLLTGSGGYFVKTNFPRVMFSAQELRQENPNVLSDVTTFIVQTTYDFKDDDYTYSDLLKEDVELNLEDTKSSLAMAIQTLINVLRKNIGKYPYLFNGGDSVYQKVHHYFFNNTIEKTMIAATSIKQANQIYEILLQQNINALISTSENDKQSMFITQFYQDPTATILIVVDRGILGFDMPKLRNVIDMSGSENPDIIFQLLGRVSRNDNTGRPKVFIKIAPKRRLERTELVTCFALALTTKAVYENYNGNYMTTPFPHFLPKTRKEGKYKKSKRRKPYHTTIDQPEVIDLADYTEILTHLKHKDDLSITGVAWVTLNEKFNIKKFKYWNLDTCKEDAKKYSTRTEWAKNSNGAYLVACDKGWLDICCEHMKLIKNPSGTWSKEKCIQDASQYSMKARWREASSSAYNTACENGWLEECCGHMKKKLSKTECLVAAKRFTTKKEWRVQSNGTYKAAWKNGWLNECCTHMRAGRLPMNTWTVDACITDAKKYSTRTEWATKSKSAYTAATKNGWLSVCCTHMLILKKKRSMPQKNFLT